jgi:hypothetical protein
MYIPDERFVLQEAPEYDQETPRPCWYWRLLARLLKPKLGTYLYSKANGLSWRGKCTPQKEQPTSPSNDASHSFEIAIPTASHQMPCLKPLSTSSTGWDERETMKL